MKLKIKENIYWNTLVRIPSEIISFIISIIVARILEPRDYGIFAVGMIIVQYANFFTNFGFNQAIVQKQIKDKRILDSIFTLDLSISTALAIIIFFSSSKIANFFQLPECLYMMKVLSIYFIITSFYTIPHSILRRNMSFKIVAIIEVGHTLLMRIISLVLAILGFRHWSLILGQVIPLFLITVIICILTKWKPRIYFNHSLMEEVYEFGFWNFTANQVDFISRNLDRFIIGKWIGASELGFYTKSISIADIPRDSIIMNINAVMFSSFSILKKEKFFIKEYLKKSMILIAIIAFPTYVGLIIIAPYFVYDFLGKKWAPMISLFQIISVGYIFRSFYSLLINVGVAIGEYKKCTIRVIISLIMFLFSCFILLQIGIIGIAVSFVLWNIILFMLIFSIIVHNINFNIKEIATPIWRISVYSVFMGTVVHICSMYIFNQYTIVNFIILVFTGITIFLILLMSDTNSTIKEIRQSLLHDILGVIRSEN